MRGDPNPVTANDSVWMPIEAAARAAGVGRRAVEAAIVNGQVTARTERGKRQVSLESVLVATTPRDLESLRRRLDHQFRPDDPQLARQWFETLREILTPVLDRLESAEARAALAEARLAAVLQHQGDGK